MSTLLLEKTMANHPITPPPELVQQWLTESVDEGDISGTHLANRAAQWGADQELEACCALLELSDNNARDFLQSARRPKPSLKERALQVLEDANLDSAHYNIILRALEQLDD
jgi:hypothetical protein